MGVYRSMRRRLSASLRHSSEQYRARLWRLVKTESHQAQTCVTGAKATQLQLWPPRGRDTRILPRQCTHEAGMGHLRLLLVLRLLRLSARLEPL